MPFINVKSNANIRKIIFGILGILLLIAALYIFCKPIYYRIYIGDRIKGNISVTIDGETFTPSSEDISGCRKSNIKGDRTQIAVKGGDYGIYHFGVNIPPIDKTINMGCYHYNWWTVTNFDIDIIIDTAGNIVTFEGDCSYVDDDGKTNKFQINDKQMLWSDPEIWFSQA